MNMFKNQMLLQNRWNEMIEALARYEANTMIEPLKPQIDNFVVKVPLVGIFSAGKSTLINTILNEKLLSVQISPETAIATEFYYTNQDNSFIGYTGSGKKIPLSKQALRNQDFKEIFDSNDKEGQGWVEAYLNSDVLALFPHVSIVDLPGLDSNLVSHNQVIDNYVDKSLAYCVVISIEDGDIRESTQRFLQELNLNKMPVILVLTKSDLKPVEEVTLVKEKIQHSVENLLGQKPLKTVVVNRKGENIDQLIKAFEAIEDRSEELFNTVVTKKIIEQITFTEQSLDKLLNTDDVSIEELKTEKEKLQQEMQSFSQKIEQESAHLQSKTSIVVRNIADTFESSLKSQVDLFTSQILAKQDISYMVTNIARTTISQGLEEELVPLITAYVDHIQSEMPHSIQIEQPNVEIGDLSSIENGFSMEEIIVTLAPILALLKFNPIIAVISTVVIPVLAKVIDIFRSEGQKKAQKIAQEEEAKKVVMATVIPKVRYEVEQILQNMVNDNISAALTKMQTQIELRKQQVQSLIAIKEQDILASTEERELRHQGYSQDKAYLSTLRKKLSSAISDKP